MSEEWRARFGKALACFYSENQPGIACPFTMGQKRLGTILQRRAFGLRIAIGGGSAEPYSGQ